MSRSNGRPLSASTRTRACHAPCQADTCILPGRAVRRPRLRCRRTSSRRASLTPGGLLVLGGAPKVGKSDLLIYLLVHMAAGVPFLGFAPPRPLRVFYLQAEIQYHYLRERMQGIRLEPSVIAGRARQPHRDAQAQAHLSTTRGSAWSATRVRTRVPRRAA